MFQALCNLQGAFFSQFFDFKNLYKDSNGYYIILKDKIDNSNFSLLPCRGGINTRKGAKYGFNEQFGVFLNSIKDYYKIESNIQKKNILKINCFILVD